MIPQASIDTVVKSANFTTPYKGIFSPVRRANARGSGRKAVINSSSAAPIRAKFRSFSKKSTISLPNSYLIYRQFRDVEHIFFIQIIGNITVNGFLADRMLSRKAHRHQIQYFA